jgi:1-acyl-sn-glycerol-3-phosphate acyltransferase
VPGSGNEFDGWWRFALSTFGRLFESCFRIRYNGEHSIPAEGGAILAPNHISVLDPILIAIPPARQGRTLRYLAAAELFGLPVIGWALRTMHQIPIRRGEGDSAALDAAIAVLKDGALAGIFPEGRVNEHPGELLRGRRGAARLSLGAGVPIVPVGIWGTQNRWPRGGPTLRGPLRTTVGISAGSAIEPEGYPDSPDDVASLTDSLMEAIRKERDRARELAED